MTENRLKLACKQHELTQKLHALDKSPISIKRDDKMQIEIF